MVDEGTTPAVVHNTGPVGAPTGAGGSRPAPTLGEDGFSIAENIRDEDAVATFIAIVHDVSSEIVNSINDTAVWLMDAYVPGRSAVGVSMGASAGAESNPMLPNMGS